MTAMTTLRTTRLSLRRPTADDVDAILAVHSDPRACAHNPSDALATRAEAEDLYQRWDNHWLRYGFGYWVVSESQETLGFCGVKFMWMPERPVLNMSDHLVIARIRPDNIASQRAASTGATWRAAGPPAS
jgi:hypothetical protein